MEEILHMSKKERERIKVLERLAKGLLTQTLAAQQLNLTTRQVRRLFKKYCDEGDHAVISKKRGSKSNNKLPDSFRDEIASIIKEKYTDFKPTLAQEKLNEIHDIFISVSTVRNIMIQYELWTPNEPKKASVHKRRDARDQFGELIQMDGSYHDWFEGRAPKCCLIVLIDDATSKLVWLQFVDWENCFSYFEVLNGYIKKYGIPLAIYTDRHAIFETSRATGIDYKDTQLHRALKTLGIKLILARTPQAKGRVERVNGVLQDRLVKEMRLAGISSLEEGNVFLPSYIERHNQKFAKTPKSTINAHKALDPDCILERVLCLHFERTISKDLMISWKGSNYQIIESNNKYRLAKKKVLVMEQKHSFEIMYDNRILEFKNFDKQPLELSKEHLNRQSDWVLKTSSKITPRPDHPWKRRNTRK